MGGPIAFRTAAAVPGSVGAVASFHGGGLVTDAPNSPHLQAAKSKAEFLIAIAENDDARSPNEKTILEERFAKANLPAEIEVYSGAAHGWCLRIRECTTSLKPRRHGAACSRCMEKLWSEHRRLFAALVILRRSLPDIRQYARTAMRANRFRIPRRGARANPSNQLASSAPQYTAQVCRSWSPAQENACRPRRHPMHLAGRIAE